MISYSWWIERFKSQHPLPSHSYPSRTCIDLHLCTNFHCRSDSTLSLPLLAIKSLHFFSNLTRWRSYHASVDKNKRNFRRIWIMITSVHATMLMAILIVLDFLHRTSCSALIYKDVVLHFLWELMINLVIMLRLLTWASCQIHKIEGCACAENARNVFPATAS